MKIDLNNFILTKLKLLVFFLPLFFLPVTSSLRGMDNFNKAYLLWLILPFLFLLYILPKFVRGRFGWQINGLEWPTAGFVFVYGVSTYLSLDPTASLWGYYGRELNPFLSLVVLVLMFFLLQQIVKSKEQISVLIRVFLLSYAVISLISFLIFVFWANNNILSIYFRHMVGSPEDLAIFLSISGVLALSALLLKGFNRLIFRYNFERIIIIFIFALSVISLVIIDFTPAWWLLLLGILSIFTIKFFTQDKETKKKKYLRLILSFLLIFLPINFLLNNYLVAKSPITQDRLVANLQLSLGQSYHTAYVALKSRPFLGYGPETWPHVFSLLRDPGLNEGKYWNIRYLKPSGFVPELIVETGVLGVLAYLFFVFFLFRQSFLFWRQNKEGGIGDKQISLSLFVIFGLVFCAGFFYPINITLFFMFWFFAAMVSVFNAMAFQSAQGQEHVFNAHSQETKDRIKYSLIAVVVLLLFLSWLIGLGFGARYYTAEYIYRAHPGDFKSLSRAALLNKNRYNYNLILARLYQARALAQIQSKDTDKIKNAEDDINKAIDNARQAVNSAPFALTAHETIGAIYRDIAPYTDSSANPTIKAFLSASKLEPSNPVLVSELAKAYVRGGYFTEAENFYKKALELKSDYSLARLGLAQAYIGEGKYDEAIQELEQLDRDNEATSESVYELGRIYFNQKRYAQAVQQFEKTLSINPLYLNALYSLGLSYEKLNDFDQALYYLKRAQKQAPINQQISAKIKEIQNIDKKNK